MSEADNIFKELRYKMMQNEDLIWFQRNLNKLTVKDIIFDLNQKKLFFEISFYNTKGTLLKKENTVNQKELQAISKKCKELRMDRMKDEIKIGEYVRTKAGIIDKVDRVIGMIENTVHLENSIWIDIKDIIKHSKSIIDLIEKGDFVNGHRIIELITLSDGKTISICVYKDKDNMICLTLKEEDIKTILTHEMYKNNCYEVEE